MADNVTFTANENATPPNGTIAATDQATSDNSQMQIVKLAIATGGSKTLIPADASGLLVNLGTNNDVAVTGNLTNISGTISLPTGAATSANQTAANASLDAIETAVEGTLTVDGSASTQPVSHAALTELAAAINTSRVDVNLAASVATVTTTITPTTAGASIFRTLDLDETEEQVSATIASLYGYYFYNAAATVLYLKFYNLTAANTTVGTSVPVMTLPLPAGQAGHISFAVPVAFSTAMTVACVTEAADSGTTGAGTGECILNVFYDN